jgi:hypothetical protein
MPYRVGGYVSVAIPELMDGGKGRSNGDNLHSQLNRTTIGKGIFDTT